MAQPAQTDADWKKSLVLPPQDKRKQTEVRYWLFVVSELNTFYYVLKSAEQA